MKPFDGLLIADFTHVLSGPFCTMLLCDLGARVIKLERPEIGEDSRQFGPFIDGISMYFETVNRGKESIGVNLKDPNDLALVKNIIKQADVVVENFRPGTMAKLGLDYDSLCKLNPRIIFASISGFGQSGSMSQLPAYDELIQAMSGFMSVTGEPDGPPIKAGPSVSDMLAGVYCFSAIATALYQREKTGKGCQIDIAMFDAMLSFLESDVVSDKMLHKIPSRIGNKHPNISPFSTFKCKDDDIVICAATDKLFASACDVMGLDQLKNDPKCQSNKDRLAHNDLIKAAFEKSLGNDTVANWYDKFVKAGVPAGPINNVNQALSLKVVKERDMIVKAGKYQLPGCPLKFSTNKETGTRKEAPKVNADGAKIKKEFK
ncbi:MULTISPECIES: CaiB/BaiF CoA transferase family protein [Cysteiniphilum]|uniref:Acetyl-CoA:oxalate CoA-transferase n=1 Tax=Cysteiniphilum litorale TaxID=2056700 RepID=A0A8J3E798_9GAMM|nr:MULTISPECIES: CoA transferase [Cysteiniphilum]GGF86901.1 acetyl-CoA:oxalate CoA-transferase [Cysteiniphilum litorale]